MFIYNTQLLLIGINSIPEFVIVVVFAVIASLVFVAASQHWFLTRNTWPETIVLLVIAFSLFRPNFWMDMVYPPYSRVAATDLMQIIEKSPPNESLRVWVEGEDINGKLVKKGMLLPLGEPGPAGKRPRRFRSAPAAAGGAGRCLARQVPQQGREGGLPARAEDHRHGSPEPASGARNG